MKLYFKQRVFSFKQRTDIFDEFGNVIFVAEGEIFSLGRRMHIYDSKSLRSRLRTAESSCT